MALCVYHPARLIPLEKVFGLEHPSLTDPAPQVPDKRTWREDRRPPVPPTELEESDGKARAWREKELVWTKEGPVWREKKLVWTAMDIMTAYATKKGWVTAKVGRPDVSRAGSASTSFSLANRPRGPLTSMFLLLLSTFPLRPAVYSCNTSIYTIRFSFGRRRSRALP